MVSGHQLNNTLPVLRILALIKQNPADFEGGGAGTPLFSGLKPGCSGSGLARIMNFNISAGGG